MGFSGFKREFPVKNADFLNDFFLIILPHPALDPLTGKTIETIFAMFANKIHILRGKFSRPMLQLQDVQASLEPEIEIRIPSPIIL